MHMQAGRRGLHGAHDVQVVAAVVARVDAALDADLGGAASLGLDRAPHDLGQVELVGRAAQRLMPATARERTEQAAMPTDVGVGDVAVDDIADHVAVGFAPQGIGRRANLQGIRAPRLEQGGDVRGRRLADLQAARQRLLGRCGQHQGGGCDRRRGRGRLQLRWPLRSRGAAGCPAVGPRQALGIAAPPHMRPQCGVEPGLRIAHMVGVGGQPRHQPVPGIGSEHGQALQRRPWLVRIHMVGRDRRHPAPVVDAGGQQLAEVIGTQVGRRLDRGARTEHQSRHGNGPQVLTQRCLGVVGHAGARMGHEVLHDHLLQVTVAPVQCAQRQQ
jgi:hypothetical protein